MAQFDRAAVTAFLRRQLRELTRELNGFHTLLQNAAGPPELAPYRAKLDELARTLADDLAQIERDLARGMDELLADLRSATAQTTQGVQILTRLLAAPLVAPTPGDRIALRLLQWIHQTDGGAATMPAACCDGEPSVYPFVLFAPLYAFPRLTRQSILYLPILFHEFGHVLFRRHRREMEDLVRELQEWISEQLEPLSTRNDLLARQQRELQRDVVDTWYAWAQEFFCDAVGLLMCGPAYLYAFASYVTRLERGDFRRSRRDLTRSSHPVLWLRIRLLTARARHLGFSRVADIYDHDWEALAGALDLGMDYFGFFESNWQQKVESVVDDMLTEVEPRPCTADEVEAGDDWAAVKTPVALLNAAWRTFLIAPDHFQNWEQANLAQFMNDTAAPMV